MDPLYQSHGFDQFEYRTLNLLPIPGLDGGHPLPALR